MTYEPTGGRKRARAFTLVETMVAVTIITVAVAGPLVSASRAIVAVQVSRDKLVASYLAQQGVEYVRQMRDEEFLETYRTGGGNISTRAWNSFLNGSNDSSITSCRANTCTLDPSRLMGTGSGFSLQICPGGTCGPLYLTGGRYTMTGTTVTPFTRSIQVIDAGTNDVRVVSRVSWNNHQVPYSVTVTDHLTPWQ